MTHPPSLWAAVTPPGPDLGQLDGDRRVDVAVIGAGFTGLSAALHLAEGGARPLVLEAADVGSGASGRNNGQVIPTLTRPDPDDIVAQRGEAGERFVALLRDSADHLFDLVRRHDLPAEAEQAGWVQPAHSPGRLGISERRVAQWSRWGAPVELVDRERMRDLLGTDAYWGGFINRSGGHINPLALARGLARAAVERGAEIAVRSPVTAIERDGGLWRLETARGVVRADAVVLATNAYTQAFSSRLAPEMAHEVVPVLSWQMATEPLDEALRRTILPGRQAVSDTHGDLRFFRYDARNRLVTGGALAVAANGAARLRPIVAERLRRLFPQIGEVRFDYVWNGHIGMTRDFLPRGHRLGPGCYAWVGCNGRGVALSVSLGRELAELARGADPADVALPLTDIEPIPLHGLAKRIAPFMIWRYRMLDRKEIAA